MSGWKSVFEGLCITDTIMKQSVCFVDKGHWSSATLPTSVSRTSYDNGKFIDTGGKHILLHNSHY